jgi:hypothetical protein
MTGVGIDGQPYKLVVARWKGQITAWWGPFRAQDADAERERIASGLRDDVVVAIEDAATTRPVGGGS